MPDGVTGTLDTTAVLLFFALPMSVAAGGALFVPWRRRYWNLDAWTQALARDGWVVAGLILMLVPEVIESQLDPFLTRHVGLDFTSVAAALDGDLHVRLQALLPQRWLHTLFTFAYVAGYPFLIIFTPILGIWTGRRQMARRALGAYALCYAAALPFYLFFPVQEVWSYDPAVTNIATSYQWVATHLYSFNEINNCFPSLHTAISAAMAGVAWRGPSRRYQHAAWILAAMIVFSTVYLGIHWVVDVVAGLVLAAVAVHLVGRRWPEPAVSLDDLATRAPAAAAAPLETGRLP
ncbi:MAG TPA: phosphatase PAP2 family protein [Candidatus Thermoplasmatota archaeon]|nr:phosphatase PAP2 family protein [Candidatus Thermoplasmatota archaeon]